MAYEFASLRIRHFVHRRKAGHQIAVAESLVGNVNGSVTMYAGAWLRSCLLSSRERLVVEHVGMAALFPEINGESISAPHGLQSGVFFQPGLRNDRAWISVGGRFRNAFTSTEARPNLVHGSRIPVELHWKVFAPHCRVFCFIIELD